MDMAEQKWLVFTSENISIVIPNEFMKMLENAWKIIYKYDWDLKMTYENKWEWKANYKYKWDNFLDYDMKNHDIHENKNVCPEFNGEKMHEQKMACKRPKTRVFSGAFWRIFQQRKGDRNAFLTEGIQAVVKIGFIVVG